MSERAIQTVVSWALCFMMHQVIHWPEEFDETLWPCAMEHAVTMWNHLPRARNGLSPEEPSLRIKEPRHDVILNARVWGCPICALDPRLQDGSKLPKWTKKSHLGMHLGTSSNHSSTVGWCLNLETGNMSPQCHVAHDELFTSVRSPDVNMTFDAESWSRLLTLGGESQLTDPHDVRGDTIPFHEFHDDFASADDDSSLAPPSTPPPPVPSVSEGDGEDMCDETGDDGDRSDDNDKEDGHAKRAAP